MNLSPFGPWHYLTYSKPFYFDISKLINDLNWRPKYSNTEMFVETYDWFIKHKDEINAKGRSVHRSILKRGLLNLIKWFS